jgi:hypothetical protein
MRERTWRVRSNAFGDFVGADDPTKAALTPTPLRVGWQHLVLFVVVLPLAFFLGRGFIADGEGGELVCDRSQNRCDIRNGWLIRDRVTFPADELEGAKWVWSEASSYGATTRKIFAVSVMTRRGSFRLGGRDADDHVKIVAAIDAFAHDHQTASCDIRVEASAISYILVAFLSLIYGMTGVAFAINWWRTRRARA